MLQDLSVWFGVFWRVFTAIVSPLSSVMHTVIVSRSLSVMELFCVRSCFSSLFFSLLIERAKGGGSLNRPVIG